MGREAILHFEKIRAFFLARLKVAGIPAGRVRIAVFSGEKNFRPYSIRHLPAFRQVTREEAFPYFHTLSFACYESGDITQARQAAARAREYAKTPEESANVEGSIAM